MRLGHWGSGAAKIHKRLLMRGRKERSITEGEMRRRSRRGRERSKRSV